MRPAALHLEGRPRWFVPSALLDCEEGRVSERRFARFYYPEFKRDYPDIYADDRAFATWMRLLAGAEDAWPATPELPRSVKSAALRMLTDRGLVTVTGDHYELRGFVTERSRREENARNAAAKRWHSDGNANASAPAMPKRERRENEESSSTRATDEPIDRLVDIWLSVKYRLPTEKQRQFLYAYLQTFDQTGLARGERLILSHPDDPIAAMKDDLAKFRAERVAELAVEEAKPRPPRAPSRPKRASDILAEWADHNAAYYREESA